VVPGTHPLQHSSHCTHTRTPDVVSHHNSSHTVTHPCTGAALAHPPWHSHTLPTLPPPHTPLPSPAGKHTLIQLSVCLVHTVVIQLSFSFHSVPPTLMPLAHLIRFRQEFFAEGAAGLNRSRLPLPGPPIFPISSFYLSVTIYT
jgi:hypothetical protein